MIDVRNIQHLVALFETGTVTAAAEKLHMSQPTMTAHLSRLEFLLGEKLFIRSAQGLEPTPMGRSFYSRGKAMLEHWQVFDQEISLLAGTELGEVRLVCGAVIEQEILPNAILRFLGDHAGVKLEVEVINPERMLARLHAGEAEIAVGAFSELNDDRVERVDAGSQSIGFYVRPGHPLLKEKRESNLVDYPLAGPQIPVNILSWLERQGFNFSHYRLVSDSYKLLKHVAMGTDLVLGGPQFVFAPEVAAGSLIRLPVKKAPLWRASILIAPAARYSRIVKSLVTCVRDEFDSRIAS